MFNCNLFISWQNGQREHFFYMVVNEQQVLDLQLMYMVTLL